MRKGNTAQVISCMTSVRDRCARSDVCVCVSMPTYLMGNSERSVKPIVLDDSAASLWGADGADVGHPQGIT